MGIALMVVLALSAIAANSASAAEVSALFTYSGSGAFTISGIVPTLETSNKLAVNCTSVTGTGQFGGKGGTAQAYTAELTMLFKGCESVGKACTSEGEPTESIITNRLVGKLGRVEPHITGILLLSTTAEFLVPAKCGTIVCTLSGSVIGTLTSEQLDESTNKLIAGFKAKAGAPGLQEIKAFEDLGGSNNLIGNLGRGPEEASLAAKITFTLNNGAGILLA